MSTIYLDKTGLAYFWSKIKAWCSSLFALDSNVVHKTGDELVQGIKEFKNAYDDTQDSTAPGNSHSIVVRTDRYRKGTDFSTLSYDDYTNIIFQDNSGSLINHDGRMASIDYCANKFGSYYLDFVCFKNSLSDPHLHNVDLKIGFDTNGNWFTAAPTPAASDNSSKIATTEWVRNATGNTALNAASASKLGSQNVGDAGRPIYFADGVPTACSFRVSGSFSDITKGVNPSANRWLHSWIYSDSTNSGDSSRLAEQRSVVDPSGIVRYELLAYDFTSGQANPAILSVVNDHGTKYVTANAPSSFADSSNKVATTWWIRNATGNTALNAATASAFDSAKSIALTGIVTGTASSTGGWTIATKPRMCRRYGGANGETRYFKVASGSLGIAWNMFDVVFLVQDYIYHSQIGLWHVRLSNGGTAGVLVSVENKFVLNANIESVGDFYLCYKNGENGNPAQYELYVAFTGASQGLGFIVLSEMEWSQDKAAASLTLYNGGASDYVSSLPSGFTSLAATNATLANSISGTASNVTGVVAIANGGTGSSTKNFIDLTSNQNNIAGDKSFSNNLQVRNNWPHLNVYQTGYTYGGTLPSNIRYSGLVMYDNSTTIMGCAEHALDNTGDSYITIWARGINQNVATGVSVLHNKNNVRIFKPNGDNIIYLGDSGNRWKDIYASNTSIETSDERLKMYIAEVPSAVLDAWEDVGFRQFKFTDAVAEKGEAGARLHVGLVAQDIDRIFSGRGLSAADYGLFCHDELDASPAVYNGDVLVEAARESGDIYSLRYGEALCMEASYMRRENARLKARVASLEERLASLEMSVRGFTSD